MHTNRIPALLISLVGTLVWAHAAAGTLRAAFGIEPEALAVASLSVTWVAGLASVAGLYGFSSTRRAVLLATAAALAGTGAAALLHPGAALPLLGIVPVAAVWAAVGSWASKRIGDSTRAVASRRWLFAGWLLLALVAAIQVGRLATFMTDRESDWFLSTRHAFYAKHDCANAYVYGAELNRRGESNVYDAAHYPGLTRDAEPQTEIRGMAPEDPYQYAPQFLLFPRLAIDLTQDYAAIRVVWFAINLTLCMAAVLALALWVGGRTGALAAWLSPLLLVSFPVLHNFQYGQFHFASIALAVLAMVAFRLGRSATGGALLAVSVLSKLFPALLLVALAAQRRWRELAWTAGAGAVLTLAALVVVGPSPFVAFFEYHLPRLADGSAFAFDEAWPEVADLVVAGNQGVAGIVAKLDALGFPLGDSAGRALSKLVGIALLALAATVGFRASRLDRATLALAWVGLLGLGSLTSTGAWADYVPLTAVWALTLLASRVVGAGRWFVWLVIAAQQAVLIGTMPIGGWSDPAWLLPLSLAGALTLAAVFVASVKPAAIPASAPLRPRAAARRNRDQWQAAGASASPSSRVPR